MLSRKIIGLIKQGAGTSLHITPDGMHFYIIECADAHIALWEHWTVVQSDKRTTRRFYLCYNPAYKYAKRHRQRYDKLDQQLIEARIHAGLLPRVFKWE